MQQERQLFSPIKQNILQFVEYLKISKREFYAKTGISRGTLESSTGITEDTMAKFIATYPDVSPDWLLTGKGSMFKEKENVPVAFKASKCEKGIPLIPIDAMAGFGNGEIQLMDANDYERYVIPAFRSAEFLIQVKGSSMYPKYASGDLVACKKLQMTSIFFQWNKVYVLDTDQGALIKRVQKSNNPDFITLISDNQSYSPFDIQLSQIYSIAIVIGVIRLE